METKLENRQEKREPPAPAGGKVNPQPHIKRVGPHTHEWQFYAIGSDGARYETCSVCFARRVVDRSLLNAMHVEWIDGTGEWDPAEDKLNPPAERDKSAEAKALSENKAADEKAAKRREERAERQAEQADQAELLPGTPIVAAKIPAEPAKPRS